jgi:transcription elongation factor Elf1
MLKADTRSPTLMCEVCKPNPVFKELKEAIDHYNSSSHIKAFKKQKKAKKEAAAAAKASAAAEAEDEIEDDEDEDE